MRNFCFKGGEMSPLLLWQKQVLPLLLSHVVNKVENVIEEDDYVYEIKMYWVVDIIRIDIKPIKRRT